MFVLDQLESRNAQLPAQIEQVVLDRDQFFTQPLGQLLAQQQPDERIEFIRAKGL